VTAAPGDTIQILSFNDYHGHVEDELEPGDRDFPDSAEDPAGGGQYLAAKLAELRQQTGFAGSLTVAAGDNIGGSPFFSGFFRDEPSVESLNAMGLDISGVGNHEFDDGIDELLRMQNGGCFDTDGDFAAVGTDNADDCFFAATPYAGADFQWLAANVIETATGDPLDLDDGRNIEDLGGYSIDNSTGTPIAFIGMTLDDTDELVSADGVDGYTFADEITTANALIPEIRAAGAEAIFVLLHEGGIPAEFEIDGCRGVSGPIIDINAGLSPEIDGVITGHTQEPYNCSLTDGTASGVRPVVSAWEHGKVVTEMTFDVDADGDVVRNTIDVVNHPVVQSELDKNPAVMAVVEKWEPLVSALQDTEVGNTTGDIDRGGADGSEDRGVESDAGNMVADAQKFAVANDGDDNTVADVAFMNPGGVRDDLAFPRSGTEAVDGIVTFGESFDFQPFGNLLISMPMNGAEIIAILEEQCQPGGSSRPFLHLGVSDGFTYDLAVSTQGGTCTSIDVSNVQIDGVDLDEAADYDVVVNSFLAAGGDNFDTFDTIPVIERFVSPLTDIEGLNAYLDAAPVDPPGTDRVNETLTTLIAPPTAVAPARLLETRSAPEFSTVDGEFLGAGRLAAGAEVELQVRGRGGVSDDAESITLNVGAILPGNPGFLTVYPCDADRPVASSVNFTGANNDSNAVTSLISEDGTVCIFSLTETGLYADVTGYSSPGGSPTAVVPARLVDDREGAANDGTIDDLFEGGGPIVGGETFAFEVAGRGGVPDDAKAALLNVVASQPAGDGFFTVFPCTDDGEVPLASNINYVAGGDFANAVTVGIGVEGTVCVFTPTTSNIVVDVNGFVPADGSPEPITPLRLAETRTGDPTYTTIDGEFEGIGQLAAETVLEIDVAGRDVIPDDTVSVTLNVATVFPDGEGFFTVFPCTDEVPNASNVNYMGGDTVANSVTTPLSADGTVCVFSASATDFVLDITAALGPIVAARPAD
jgi:5'-nucleotidase